MFHPDGPTVWELLVQALSSMERAYDALAPKFDYTPFRTPEAILVPALAHLGGPGTLATALDVCCGTGAALRHLRPLCRDRVVGLDVSQGMLAVARRLTTAAPGEAGIALVCANALAMPFTAAFDAAVCFGALGHIRPRDQARFVAQVAQVLKPGGRFVCVTASTPPWWSARWWRGRGFNALMHLRNRLPVPPLHMYYLTWPVPATVALLCRQGFTVTVHRHVFATPFRDRQLVIGTWAGGAPASRSAP